MSVSDGVLGTRWSGLVADEWSVAAPGSEQCSTKRLPPRTRSPRSQSAYFGKQTATGSGSSPYTSRTALLTKGTPSEAPTTWLPSVHDGGVKCGLGVRRHFPPDASPPRCAQLMGLASRGCLVFVLGATAERRNLLFRSDLGLPWAASKHPCTSRYPRKTSHINHFPAASPLRGTVRLCNHIQHLHQLARRPDHTSASSPEVVFTSSGAGTIGPIERRGRSAF